LTVLKTGGLPDTTGGEKKRAHRREAFLHSGGVLVRNQAFRFNAIVLGIVLLQTSTRTMKGALGA
jgi:hypothetical protein